MICGVACGTGEQRPVFICAFLFGPVFRGGAAYYQQGICLPDGSGKIGVLLLCICDQHADIVLQQFIAGVPVDIGRAVDVIPIIRWLFEGGTEAGFDFGLMTNGHYRRLSVFRVCIGVTDIGGDGKVSVFIHFHAVHLPLVTAVFVIEIDDRFPMTNIDADDGVVDLAGDIVQHLSGFEFLS